MAERRSLTSESRHVLGICWEALEDTKADDIQVLDISEQSSITDFLFLASANSDPHLRALKRELDKALKAQNVKIVGVDDNPDTGWSVVDAFDVMIHIFTPEKRETYNLETLWKDAFSIEREEIFQDQPSKSA